MIKISIIVPCYNVELYIQECMESILSQSIYEIEIILIDDGSTDRTLEILEAYQEKCANVKILKQANQGFGIALYLSPCLYIHHCGNCMLNHHKL